MSRSVKTSVVYLMGVFSLFSSSAHAMRVSLVGLADSSQVNYAPATITMSGQSVSLSSSGKMGFGDGALLGFSMIPLVEFETGALYITRKYDEKIAAVGLTQTDSFTQHAVQIPMLLRLHLLRYLTIGAGGYAAIGTGNVTDVSDNALSTGTTTTHSQSYSDAGIKSKDYGWLASVGLRMPVAMGTSFIVDGRYAKGLSDTGAVSGVKTTYTDTQILAGLQFHLGFGR